MNREQMMQEYMRVLENIQSLRLELQKVKANNEKIQRELQPNKSYSLDSSSPTLIAFERMADKYGTYIEYISQRLDTWTEQKERMDKSLGSFDPAGGSPSLPRGQRCSKSKRV